RRPRGRRSAGGGRRLRADWEMLYFARPYSPPTSFIRRRMALRLESNRRDPQCGLRGPRRLRDADDADDADGADYAGARPSSLIAAFTTSQDGSAKPSPLLSSASSAATRPRAVSTSISAGILPSGGKSLRRARFVRSICRPRRGREAFEGAVRARMSSMLPAPMPAAVTSLAVTPLTMAVLTLMALALTAPALTALPPPPAGPVLPGMAARLGTARPSP